MLYPLLEENVMKPFALLTQKPALVAHRGGSKLAPENTLLAFGQAIERYQSDQLEMDVRLSRDGVPVIFHDEWLDRTTNGEGPVADLCIAELQRLDAGHQFTRDAGRSFPFRGMGIKIPTLDEVLEAFSTPMMMELKTPNPDCRRAVIESLRCHHAIDRVCLGAENDTAALDLAAELPEVCRFFPRGASHTFLAHVLSGRRPDVGPFDVMALPYEQVIEPRIAQPLLEAAHALGLLVQVWTVDDPSAMRVCLRLGFDGVISDRPDELRRIIDEERGLTPCGAP